MDEIKNFNINTQFHIMVAPVNYFLKGTQIPEIHRGSIFIFKQQRICIGNPKIWIFQFQKNFLMDNYISLAKENIWEQLEFMVQNGTGNRNIFWQVEQINIIDMDVQAHGYFVMLGIKM